jgi:hypothetical protein
MAKITCEQLVLLQVADPDHLAIWLSGYYNGKRNTTNRTSEGNGEEGAELLPL